MKSLQTLKIVVYAKGGIDTGIKFEAQRVDKDSFRGTVEFKDENPLYIILMGAEHSYVENVMEQVTFK